MNLKEFTKNYYNKGFLDFVYLTGDMGVVTVKQADGTVFRQRIEIEDSKAKFGDIEFVEQQKPASNELEELPLNDDIRVRINSELKNELNSIASVRGMKLASYVRTLIENDIIRERNDKERGYVIL